MEELIHPKVDREVNAKLCNIPEREEIRRVVWQLHPLKALGLDGFSICFYKEFLNIVGDDVVNFVKDFFCQ